MSHSLSRFSPIDNRDIQASCTFLALGHLRMLDYKREDAFHAEAHWNGEILDSFDKAIEWMKTMTWKGQQPIVHFLEKAYQKGIRLAKDEMKKYDEKIYKSTIIPP